MRPDLAEESRTVISTPPRAGLALAAIPLLLLCGIGGCGASDEPGTPDENVEAGISSEGSPGSPNGGADTSIDSGTTDGWLTGSTRIERTPTGVVTVTDVRAARHDAFDRFVIALSGGALPTYSAEISTGPATQCGSGEPVDLPGEAVLILALQPAQAHDDAGNSTLEPRDTAPGLPALLEARLICDFEGHVEWAFGIADATAFRVLELSEPNRIALDIQH